MGVRAASRLGREGVAMEMSMKQFQKKRDAFMRLDSALALRVAKAQILREIEEGE